MCAFWNYSKDASEYQYAAMNPWVAVDLIPLRGISPRVDNTGREA
jgi:hypothetical protein